MKKVLLLLSLTFFHFIGKGNGNIASFVAPTMTEYPSNSTTNSILVGITDTNSSEVSIEIEYSNGITTKSIFVSPITTSLGRNITGLLPKNTYRVRARALGCLSSTGCPDIGPWSAPIYTSTKMDFPPNTSIELEANCPRNVGFAIKPQSRPEDVFSYVVRRSYDNVTYNMINEIPGYSKYYYDQDMVPGQRVWYNVVGTNSTGQTTSNTLMIDVKPFSSPQPPFNLRSTNENKTDTQLYIRWENPVGDLFCGSDLRATYYIMIKREGQNNFTKYTEVYGSANSALIKGLKPNETVEFDIFSLSDMGKFSTHVYGKDKTWGPASPVTGLIAVAYKDALNHSSIDIKWDPAPVESEYFVIEYSKDGVNFEELGKVASYVNSFKHEPVEEGLPGKYRVKAGNNIYGESSYNTIDITGYPYSAVPNAPYGLSGKVVNNFVNLKWYDDSSKEEFYLLERSIDNSNNFSEIAKLNRNSNTYIDKNVSTGKTYYYRVKASNPLGVSKESNIAEVKINSTLGLIDNNDLNIYPNPTIDYFTINVPEFLYNKNIVISILDDNNKVVYKNTYNTNLIKINANSLKSGVYKINMISDNFNKISRLVKY